MEKLTSISIILYNITASIAVIIGGSWALYRFKIFRENTSNPQIRMEYEVLPYSEKSKLLVATIKVRNIGNIRIYPKKITFSLKILPENKSIGEVLHWNDGKYLLEDFNVIEGANPDMKEGVYMLEVNDEYPELLTVIVPSKSLLIARAYYIGTEDDEKDEFGVYATWHVN